MKSGLKEIRFSSLSLLLKAFALITSSAFTYSAIAVGGSTSVQTERASMGGLNEETFFLQEGCKALAMLNPSRLGIIIDAAGESDLERFCRTEDDLTCAEYDEFVGEWGYLKTSSRLGYCKLIPIGSN